MFFIHLLFFHVFFFFEGMNMINSTQWPKINKYHAQVEDDDVFMVKLISFANNNLFLFFCNYLI